MFGKVNGFGKKFGIRPRDMRRDYVYNTVMFGTVEEMLREAKLLNRIAKRIGDRRYFVYPVAGPLNHAVLIVGREARGYPN